ncbi:tyrosine-type recombinase/integrase [Streptococcus gallolyticus]|uniref:Site-specific recombinase XerD n=1 Tax=Streptococcus gallolyticus TaxID=315405 RepID=A0A1H9QJI1_9STRE|nr:site-specific integrase [Streptococcus gallolyticus]SER60622.1 Site-specific recombinase XerD [Streptococcus gallolyticus]
MWPENHKSGKINFVERYRDPYTQKWKRVSTLMDRDTPRARKEAQRILDRKIKEKLAKLTTTDAKLVDVINEWWNHHKSSLKPTSQKTVGYKVKNLVKVIDEAVLLSKVTTKFLQNLIDNISGSYEKKKRIRQILKQTFDYAISIGYVSENPATGVKLSKPPKTIEDFENVTQKYLERDELDRLLKELNRRKSSKKVALLAEFMTFNGCRFGEAIALRPENIKNNYVEIHGTLDYMTSGYENSQKQTPKTDSSWRETLLTKREKEILDEIQLINGLEKNTNKNYKETGYIFISRNGIPLQDNSFNKSIQAANDRLSKPIPKHLTSHIFRHTLVSFLAEKGVPLKAIMDRVGHSDSKTTIQIYTHITKNMKSQVVDVLDGL